MNCSDCLQYINTVHGFLFRPRIRSLTLSVQPASSKRCVSKSLSLQAATRPKLTRDAQDMNSKGRWVPTFARFRFVSAAAASPMSQRQRRKGHQLIYLQPNVFLQSKLALLVLWFRGWRAINRLAATRHHEIKGLHSQQTLCSNFLSTPYTFR